MNPTEQARLIMEGHYKNRMTAGAAGYAWSDEWLELSIAQALTKAREDALSEAAKVAEREMRSLLVGNYSSVGEADRSRDLRRQRIATLKSSIAMKWHCFYWKILHLTKLARPYSVLMCWNKLYVRFPDGRCAWCGEKHSEAP